MVLVLLILAHSGREWVLLIPVANIVFAIWNGVDGANGMTTADYTKAYGTSFF